MNFKKIVVLLLCVAILCSFNACSAAEDSEIWLPFGLKFGMTYDEVSQQLYECGITVSALEPAEANDGYVTKGIDVNLNDSTVWDFLNSPTLKTLAEEEIDIMDDSDLWKVDLEYTSSHPVIYFRFNQDQKLYEFYCFWTCFTDTLPSVIIPEIITNYNTKLGTAEAASAFSCTWDTQDHRVSISYSPENAHMVLVHHCNKYDLTN